MVRSFDTHRIRQSRELGGLWDFCTEAQTQDKQRGPGEWPMTMPVPACWEQHPDLRTMRGVAWYRKTVTIARDCAVRLEFKGVSHTATVFWDGLEQVGHYNAYTPFSCVIPRVKAGTHEIRVKVDNSFSEASTLHIGNDYYTYGGIIRPVLMEELPESFVERMEWLSTMKDDGNWQARIKVLVRNPGNEPWHGRVRIRLMDSKGTEVLQESGPVALAVSAGGLESSSLTMVVCGAQSWSAESPRLYLVQAVLDQAGEPGCRDALVGDGVNNAVNNVVDDLIERVGFREVAVANRQILVNRTPVYLKGFNRHEDMGLLGATIPFQMMHHDLSLMRDMGCNTVRTSHYPNDELFLDLCDELGFLVWEENHARGLSIEHMRKPPFEDQCRDCNREMVEAHLNHPSIIIWGLLNECASWCEEGKAIYRRQYEQIRALDTSRPLTHASCHHGNELCLDLCDIVSMNVYSGWYNDNPVAKTWDEILGYIETHGGAGKPCLISEFGAAGLYGWRDPGREKWSEERQSDILEEAIRVYSRRPEIRGLLIWQFADCRVTEGSFYARPRCHNNKGIVDDWRRPKLAYNTVKQAFRSIT